MLQRCPGLHVSSSRCNICHIIMTSVFFSENKIYTAEMIVPTNHEWYPNITYLNRTCTVQTQKCIEEVFSSIIDHKSRKPAHKAWNNSWVHPEPETSRWIPEPLELYSSGAVWSLTFVPFNWDRTWGAIKVYSNWISIQLHSKSKS